MEQTNQKKLQKVEEKEQKDEFIARKRDMIKRECIY